MSLPKPRRVLQSSEFKRIYQNGIRVTSRHFAAFCLRTGDNEKVSRFGFTVPRALGSAVIRNRLKRRTREAVRAELSVLSSGWAIVFNPRKSTEFAPFGELRREVSRVFARCSAP